MSAPEDIDGIGIDFIGCGEIALTRENSGLYTFAGRNAVYDHVFVRCTLPRHPRVREAVSGHFIFAGMEYYDLVRDAMLSLNYPHMHETAPLPREVTAFDCMMLEQADTVADLFPDLA